MPLTFERGSCSTDNKGGTLSDFKSAATKGFRYTFALARTYGGLVGEYKLDWFCQRICHGRLQTGGSYMFAPHFARRCRK